MSLSSDAEKKLEILTDFFITKYSKYATIDSNVLSDIF